MTVVSAAESSVPFAPATYDVVWTIVAVLGLVLLAAAMVAWARSTDRSIVSLAWFFVLLALPIIGPIGYLLESRRRRGLARAESEQSG